MERPDSVDPHLRTAPGFRERLEWTTSIGHCFWGLAENTFLLQVSRDIAFHFDFEGRLRRAFVEGKHYLRGLDGHLLRKIIHRTRVPQVRAAPFGNAEAATVYARAHKEVSRALEALPSSPEATGRLTDYTSVVREARRLLKKAAAFTPSRLAAESSRFLEVYAPLGVLPPDAYSALILQATRGCRYNQCSFCTLYQGVEHRVLGVEEFREHVNGVRAFLGAALALRRGVFLGEANALEIPSAQLREILEAVRDGVPEVFVEKRGRIPGVSAFSDAFGEHFHDQDTLRSLASRGLERVYLGAESGNDEVLSVLSKPASRRRIAARVGDLKAAGVTVGVIFLVGAGGRAHSRGHVEGTVSLARELPLDQSDIVYLSRLQGRAGTLSQGNVLSTAELESEEQELLKRLRGLGLRVSRYDLSAFIYY